jgi:hypothetical protein
MTAAEIIIHNQRRKKRPGGVHGRHIRDFFPPLTGYASARAAMEMN